MRKLYYLLFLLPLVMIGCQSNESALRAPSHLSNIHVRPDTGSVTVYWDLPADSSVMYVKVSTKKYPNRDSSKIISTQVSSYTDSITVTGLLHKYQYVFKVQAYNVSSAGKKSGKVFKTQPISPIRRPVKDIPLPDKSTQISIDTSMISAPTHDYQGNVAGHVLDGDIGTFWQSAWYYHPHQAPFYLYINFPQKESVGLIKYALRQTSDARGFPTQFGIAISEDGKTWHQVWKSAPNLPVSPVSKHFQLILDKNYTSKHFRIGLLKTHSKGATFCHLSELSLYTLKIKSKDTEKTAIKNYDQNFFINFVEPKKD